MNLHMKVYMYVCTCACVMYMYIHINSDSKQRHSGTDTVHMVHGTGRPCVHHTNAYTVHCTVYAH